MNRQTRCSILIECVSARRVAPVQRDYVDDAIHRINQWISKTNYAIQWISICPVDIALSNIRTTGLCPGRAWMGVQGMQHDGELVKGTQLNGRFYTCTSDV